MGTRLESIISAAQLSCISCKAGWLRQCPRLFSPPCYAPTPAEPSSSEASPRPPSTTTSTILWRGSRPSTSPDVTVSTTTEHLLKMFNREVDAIKMIVEGHVKVTGEFDKALSLKEVLIAAREAESH